MTMSQCSTCRAIYTDDYNYGLTLADDLPNDVELSYLLNLCQTCIKKSIGIA
jgi:hypothetical protein